MDKYSIAKKIEDFAPPELAESWDCSGWAVNVKSKYEIAFKSITKPAICK